MLTYDHLLNVVLPPLLPSQTFTPLAAGVLARTTIAAVMSPLELIRTNLQSTPRSPEIPNTLRSTLTSISYLARSQGLRHLWRGFSPTLWRDVPFSGIYWASYESLKDVFAFHGFSGAWVAFISGAVSGTTAALITSPFDVLKTRRQSLIMSSPKSKAVSTLSLLEEIVRVEGSRALFAGIGPRIAKIAPACGIMISSFEVCRQSSFHLFRSSIDFCCCSAGHWKIFSKIRRQLSLELRYSPHHTQLSQATLSYSARQVS